MKLRQTGVFASSVITYIVKYVANAGCIVEVAWFVNKPKA